MGFNNTRMKVKAIFILIKTVQIKNTVITISLIEENYVYFYEYFHRFNIFNGFYITHWNQPKISNFVTL